MSGAVVLFGIYSELPSFIRIHGRQAGYAGGHALYVARQDAAYVPPFLDEFAAETDRTAAGVPIYTDCVPAAGVQMVNYASRGRQAPCTPAEREALQHAMGTSGQPADELDLAAGILLRYGRRLDHGRSWQAVVSAIGSGGTYVTVGDPLATSYITAKLSDLKLFAAGLQYRYVRFVDTPTLPDTAAEEYPVWTTTALAADKLLTIPALTAIYLQPGDQQPAFVSTRESTAHAVLQVPGWWGYVLANGGVRWVPMAKVTASAVPGYDAGVIAERHAAIEAVAASKP